MLCYLHYIWIQSSTQHCWYQLVVLSIWICLWEKRSINFVSNVATSVCALEFTIIFHLFSILKQTKVFNFYACARKITFFSVKNKSIRTHSHRTHSKKLTITLSRFLQSRKPVLLRMTSGERFWFMRCSQSPGRTNSLEQSGSRFILKKYSSSTSVVPNLFGTRDWFHGR